MRALRISAPGKINLGLEVLERRPDGYHEIRTLMLRISMADTLEVRTDPGLGVRWPPSLVAPQPDLIRRAAEVLRMEAPSQMGARITLDKRIPIGAGLGGGSADAAAALIALNRLWGLRWPRRRLAALAASVGSDVPFLIGPSPALASGRGEVLRPLRPSNRLWVVIVAPDWSVPDKTRRIYAALEHRHFSSGSRVMRAADQLEQGFDPANLDFTSAFEPVVPQLFPAWPSLRADLERRTGARFWLSGAGPSMYAIALSRPDALRIQGLIGQDSGQVFVASSVTHRPRPRTLQ